MKKRLAEKLPDAYCKRAGSNNDRLLALGAEAIETLRRDAADVAEAAGLWNAGGETLNLFGDMAGQKRGRLSDAQYRHLILAHVARNFTQGDYGSIRDAIMTMLMAANESISPADVAIAETERSGVVRLEKFPMTVLNTAGFTSRQAVDMIQAMLPVCVTLEVDVFEGTFCFAGGADEYDETAGFADGGQTMGGYFGLLLGEDGSVPLPI